MHRHGCTRTKGQWIIGIALTAAVILSAGLGEAKAQGDDVEVKIQARPLTGQEIRDLGLPTSTQIGSGLLNVGVGQPVYLEALVSKGAEVIGTTWSIDGVRDQRNRPLTSAATLMPSPLDASVPPYDGGDAADYDVAGRRVLVPDLEAAFDISVEVQLAGGSESAESTVVGAFFQSPWWNNGVCTLCHGNKFEGTNTWLQTHHAYTFEKAITGESTDHFQAFCISCHTVGYDTTPGAVNGGFDDVAMDINWEFPATPSPTNWTDMDPALQAKSNVQCENCHGPAGEHMYSLGETDRIGITLSAGNCGQCHDRLGHHVKNSEWATAAHSQGYVFRDSGSCAQCHSSIGFIDYHDPDYAVYTNGLGEVVDPKPRGTGNEGLGCVTCHDPHEPGNSGHQVRSMDGAPLGNDTVLRTGGRGILCMNCHQSRRDATSYVDDFDWGDPNDLNTFRGPHHGPQADMLAGENAYEFGLDLPSTRAHLGAVADSCVTCHMQDLDGTEFEEYLGLAGGHTWAMTAVPTDGGEEVNVTLSCQECHGGIEDFNIGGEDWDRNGMVEGTQHEIENLLHIVESLLPAGSPDPGWSTEQLGAYYNAHFVTEDGSLGVHNPKYAAALLQASWDALTGGIDVDQDGLLDSWEIEQFGDLTSQSGDDDYDDDGLVNSMEYSLGTKPKEADSDGDGYSDRVEVEGYSDPLDPGSVPDPDMVTIEPAVELGYLSTNVGSLLQFQSIDALTGFGGWVNTGSVQTNMGDWVFQLEATREATNRFYRVVEE
jgi:hypothetical protein